MKTKFLLLPLLLLAALTAGAQSPAFPSDPGTVIYDLQLVAAVIDGEQLPEYAPTGGGGYPAGTSVTITAKAVLGYEFTRWSDGNTENPRSYVVEQSASLIAYYSRKQIEITVDAGQWTFFCLPPLGDRQYVEEMFSYVGLSDVKWGTYNGTRRAIGKSGWDTPKEYNAMQGYIIYSSKAGTLRINAYEDEIPQSAVSCPFIDYPSVHPENASWNFLGNPYNQGYNIAGLTAAGIESPIAVWNGTAYSTYTPGIDTYILQPYEAFFIQKAEGGTETVTFSREYLSNESNGGNNGDALIEGELSGAFSVSATEKVHFSQGNLQYQATTALWRFAENQYDMIGEDNSNISDSYSGWIDLFGWGTGNNPTLASQDNSDYSIFADWGANAISNGGNEANTWRTLTKDEWCYIFCGRVNASELFGVGSVNGINGTILLPDDWELPSGASFFASTNLGLVDNASGCSYDNSTSNNFSHNTYTLEEWSLMELAGAVFLPAAGFRRGTEVTNTSTSSNPYWSATMSGSTTANILTFSNNNLSPRSSTGRNFGQSVRLVR